MSRNFIPAMLAIGIGVFTGTYWSGFSQMVTGGSILTTIFSAGYYTFQPTFQQLAVERTHGGQSPASNNAGNAPAEGDTTAPAKSHATGSKPVGENK